MGRRFGESDLLAARRMFRGKAAYRGFIEVACVRRMRRQVREVNAVADHGVLSNALELALYYANQYSGGMLSLENQTWYIELS